MSVRATSAGDLRVAVVTHYWDPHVGGIETVARQQAHELARRGAQVEVHTSRLPRTAPQVSTWRPPSGDGTVRVVRHAAADPLARALQVPVPLPGPGMARALMAAARRCDVVVAHGHTYLSSAMAAWAARAARRPLVLVQHSPWVAYGPTLDAVERTADRVLGRRVIAAAARTVCVSEHTAAYVRSIVPEAPTVVIHNGVDRARFSPTPDGDGRRDALAGEGDAGAAARPVVLFVGRLVRRNGWPVLIDAWRGAGLGERAELHLVGGGPDAHAVSAAAAGLPGVRVLGRVPDEELADRYRAASVVVVPTTTGEGFGMVAAEALACGTPVVASAQGGLAEVVRDGVDGLLVPPGDAGALGRALVRAVDDRPLLALLARGARARDLSDVRATDALVDVLLDVVGESTRGRVGSPVGSPVGSAA
jgi:D-inositol-3-phosphate glycosyltransferase